MDATDEPGSLLEAETLRFSRELIRIPTVNTGDRATIGDGEARAARLIQGYLHEVGFETHYVEPVPGRGNVVARLAGSDPTRGALVLHAHLDVVPAEADDWTYPPFAAEIHDGALHGRGALDLKTYAAVLLATARHLVREDIVPGRDLVFAFFADEEAGGVDGAKWLLDERREWFAGATEALGEVGGFSFPIGSAHAYLVATAEKGSNGVWVTARGQASHASRPTATNPVSRVASAIHRIATHEFDVIPTSASESFARGVSSLLETDVTSVTLPGVLDRLGGARPLIEPSLRTTASPTRLDAGYKSNVIPARARAYVDVRTLPGHHDSARAEIDALAGPDVDVEWLPSPGPVESHPDSPLLDVLAEATRSEDPDAVLLPYLLPASTDSKHFAGVGIQGYGFVPFRTALEGFDAFGLFHAVDERIPLDALFFAARVTARIAATA
jgi:acetylornithine deacetylase/succinyl-diaminopimelate desuccinylase-like protein